MTQVFISALSTTRLELNQEDLEYYLDEKNKQILEVRQFLEYLHQFSISSIKQRMQMNYSHIWKGVNILAKIIGYENQLIGVNKLQLPEQILLQDLITSHSIFCRKNYRSFQVATRWNGKVDSYLILLEGVIEREVIRNSFMDHSGGGGNLLMKADSIGKKKNTRKRFVRNDDQIPVCLNSKRNQSRNIESNAGFFRSLTISETFEVDVSGWKKYVNTFQRIQNHYVLNFIRKKLNISLNLQLQKKNTPLQKQQNKQQKEEGTPPESPNQNTDKIYKVKSFERKSSFQLHTNSVFLVYSGEILIETNQYKIQTSRGCVLNTAVGQFFYLHKQHQRCLLGHATPKTDCVVIELDIIKLLSQFELEPEDYKQLQKLLCNFQKTRKINQGSMFRSEGLNRINIQRKTQGQQSHKSNQDHLKVHYSKSPVRSNKFTLTQVFTTKSKNTTFLPNCKGKSQNINPDKKQERIGRNSTKIFPCQQIQNRIIKTQKAAQLIKNQQAIKAQSLSNTIGYESSKQNINTEFEQCVSILNNKLFKDCLSCIQTRNDLLKRAVMKHRNKKVETQVSQQNYQAFCQKEPTKVFRDISSEIIKRKIKEIYTRTQGNECDYLEEQCQQNRKRNTFMDSNPLIQGTMLTQKFSHTQNILKSRGIMKKIQKGQVRRVPQK